MSKPLSEMTLEELWQLFPIILKEHSSEYTLWYELEERNLSSCIGAEKIYRISHIGSSAVQGLLSKPTVDILLEIKKDADISAIAKLIESEGWILMSSKEEPYVNYSFNKGYTPQGYAQKVFHLHLRFPGDWGELYFKDYLGKHSTVASEYAQLKLTLLEKYRNDRDAYTREKTDFITSYTAMAREEFKNRYRV